jgi:hypothetical protein
VFAIMKPVRCEAQVFEGLYPSAMNVTMRVCVKRKSPYNNLFKLLECGKFGCVHCYCRILLRLFRWAKPNGVLTRSK